MEERLALRNKPFWGELARIQKQMHIFCSYVVVLDRPASDLYITSIGVGKIKRNTYKIEAIFFSDFGLAEFLHLF